MRRLLVGWVLALLVLSGCSGGGGGSGGTGKAAAPDEPGAGGVGPAASGDDVSVNRVLAGLDGVIGDVQRMLVRDRRITPEATDRLQAVYTGPELLNQIDAFKV